MGDIDLPSPDVATNEDGELRLGSSERGTAANGVILALTRAARSFLLYDPANEAIRHFLQVLRETVEGFLQRFGDLKLVVRPFELVVEGEVVYLDRDRERSLAFRLFRDGVRSLTVAQGLSWQELLKLLEVLSIRYTGVRQTEDDMVVLLWKAGFQHIQIEAVEGFIPEDEVGDAGEVAGGTGGGGGHHVDAPPDFDLPAPVLKVPGPAAYRRVPEEAKARVVEQDSTQALPELCVRLVEELLKVAVTPTDPLSFDEIVPQLREIRDFLLSEGLLDTVHRVVARLHSARLGPHEAKERDALLASFADERALGRILASVPRDSAQAPPELVALLELVPGDHLETLLKILTREHAEAPRRVARSLVERWVPKRAAWIVQQLANADSHLACELLRTLAYADIGRALEGVGALAGRTDVEVLLECLHVLERAPDNPVMHRLLLPYLAAPHEEARHRALALAGKRRIATVFPPLLERVKREAPLRLTPKEAEVLGDTLARTDPAKALDAFREWIKPRGFFAGVLPGAAMLQWTAVSGLAVLPGDEPEQLIKLAGQKGGADLQRHCTAQMVRRRRLGRGADT